MVSSPTATTRDVWTSLETIFRSNTLARAINLTNELYAERQGDLSITSYCARLKSISDRLWHLGHPLPTHALLLVLLCHLHPHHKMMAKIIQRDATMLSFTDAQNMLVLDEQQDSSTGRIHHSATLLPCPSSNQQHSAATLAWRPGLLWLSRISLAKPREAEAQAL
jgi:hypothetical protein